MIPSTWVHKVILCLLFIFLSKSHGAFEYIRIFHITLYNTYFQNTYNMSLVYLIAHLNVRRQDSRVQKHIKI